MKTFFVGFYFDQSSEQFEIDSIHTDKLLAEKSLAELPEQFKTKVVSELTLSAIKNHLLHDAIEKAKEVQGITLDNINMIFPS